MREDGSAVSLVFTWPFRGFFWSISWGARQDLNLQATDHECAAIANNYGVKLGILGTGCAYGARPSFPALRTSPEAGSGRALFPPTARHVWVKFTFFRQSDLGLADLEPI